MVTIKDGRVSRGATWGLSPSFWALWTAQLVNRVASFAQPFLVLYLTQDRAVPVSTAGAISGAVGVGLIVANIVGGWMSDRIGRKVTIVGGQILTAAALVWLASADSLTELWLSAVLVGLGGDLVRPAMSATVGDIVNADKRVRAYGMLFWAVNLGFAAAAVSGGFLTRWGYPTLFLVNALASIVAGAIILKGVPETKPNSSRSRQPFLRPFLRDHGTLILFVVDTIYSLVYFQAYSTLPLVMSDKHISPALYGVVLAVNGVIICFVQPLSLRYLERISPLRVFGGGMLIVGAGFAGTAAAGEAWHYMVTVAVWTLGEIAVVAVVAAMFANRAPDAHRGRYMSLVGLALALGAALGPALGAGMLEVFGATTLWLSCGAICVAGASLLRFVGADATTSRTHQ
ncbi:MDR family MFS transporter [Kocuria marina]|uniref:MDR family MFS transporter n=1 Tax=Kocuria marina TaxID=223184 RepID=UPI0011AAF4E9|nr:MFS transporter [Kocuria indica]